MLQKASLEGTLRDTEMRYNMEIENLNSIILQLEAELMQLRNNIQQQTQDYEILLNMKMKLEAEIATYRRLLEGGDFKWVYVWNLWSFYHPKFADLRVLFSELKGSIFLRLEDAVEEQKKVKVMTVTQTLVDGKVVSSTTETKERKA